MSLSPPHSDSGSTPAECAKIGYIWLQWTEKPAQSCLNRKIYQLAKEFYGRAFRIQLTHWFNHIIPPRQNSSAASVLPLRESWSLPSWSQDGCICAEASHIHTIIVKVGKKPLCLPYLLLKRKEIGETLGRRGPEGQREKRRGWISKKYSPDRWTMAGKDKSTHLL